MNASDAPFKLVSNAAPRTTSILQILVNYAEITILTVWNVSLRMSARDASLENMPRVVNVNFVRILMRIVWSAVMKNVPNAV